MSLNKKALGASAAVVALSAFVPNPFLMGDAMAQATASDTLKISAKVSNPLGVNSGTELNFGTFAVSAGGGSFTFNQGGTTINTGVLLSTGQLGSVTFTAPKNAAFTISVPDFNGADIFIDTAAGSNNGANTSKTMTVTTLKFVATNTTAFKIDNGTAATFSNGANTATGKVLTGAAGTTGKASIGGKLLFDGGQNVGTYQGTYTVSITF